MGLGTSLGESFSIYRQGKVANSNLFVLTQVTCKKTGQFVERLIYLLVRQGGVINNV